MYILCMLAMVYFSLSLHRLSCRCGGGTNRLFANFPYLFSIEITNFSRVISYGPRAVLYTKSPFLSPVREFSPFIMHTSIIASRRNQVFMFICLENCLIYRAECIELINEIVQTTLVNWGALKSPNRSPVHNSIVWIFLGFTWSNQTIDLLFKQLFENHIAGQFAYCFNWLSNWLHLQWGIVVVPPAISDSPHFNGGGRNSNPKNHRNNAKNQQKSCAVNGLTAIYWREFIKWQNDISLATVNKS